MPNTRRHDARLLDAGELELVDQTRHPALCELEDDRLTDIIKRLRERRDRARGIVARQRREARGKSATPGARPVSGETGAARKSAALTAALKRISKEHERRRAARARDTLVANARRALRKKTRAENDAPSRPRSRTPGRGMAPNPNERLAPSGALNAEGHRPVLERSRKVR